MTAKIGISTDLVDYSSITKLSDVFKNLAATLGPGISKVKPEFGAYMSYSYWLEVGTKKVPRPGHIVKAVVKHATFILTHVMKASLDLIEQAAKGNPLSRDNVTVRFKHAWAQALNDKPRRTAVKNAPFEFGFHRRSIFGYVNPRKESVVLSQQEKAASAREEKATRERGEWTL